MTGDTHEQLSGRSEIETVVRGLHDIWNSGDVSRIPEIYSDSFVAHMPKGWECSEFRGHDGVRDAIMRIRSAFSNWHEEVQDLIVDQDRAVTRYVSTGVHTGSFIGLEPSGRRVTIDEISIYRLAAGKVEEQWCLTDDLALAQQLGLIVD